MRVAIVVSQFPCESETFITHQVASLIEGGHDVEIFADIPGAPIVDLPPVLECGLNERMRYPVSRGSLSLRHVAPTVRHTLRLARAGFRSLRHGVGPAILALQYILPAEGRTRHYDIIHSHFGPNGIKAAALRSAGALTGRLIVTFHGYDLSQYLREHGSAAYRRLWPDVDLCLAVTERWRDRLVELGCPAEKARVHRMGVDIDCFAYVERQPRNDRPVEIVTVARLVDKKGLDYAIHAVAEVIDRRPANYTIIGDGPARSRLEALITKLGVGKSIRISGWREPAEVQATLNAADVFLVPSVTAPNGDQEGLPVALMEAMATGLPAVCSYHSGIPELIRDNVDGFLVPERDAAALAKRLADLIDNPGLRAVMGRNARLRVEEHHDHRRLSEELVEIYSDVLRRNCTAAERLRR